jgi:rhamnosyl/mannosyltransferase
MTRARVLHVYKDYYPPVLGGIECTINLMARGVAEEFDARVLVCAGRCTIGEEVVQGVRVTRVAEWGRFSSAPVSPAFVGALRRLAADADIIHLHHPNPTGDIALLLARPGKPLVMTYHSDIVRQRFSMVLFGPVQERTMRACRVIMPTSPSYIESSEWLSRHRDKCRVVPLGIDLSRFEPTETVCARTAAIRAEYAGPVVLFVGRLRYYKGLEYLLRAAPDIRAKVLIGGTGPDLARLQGIVRECGAEGRVAFLGDLPEEELVAHLHAADVFCMPSHLRSEAFGLSMVEALACGVPVVSTNIATGVPFVNADGETGFCVEPASPMALRDALNRVLGDASLRARMSEAARRRAHGMFSAERMCTELVRVYRAVLGLRE